MKTVVIIWSLSLWPLHFILAKEFAAEGLLIPAMVAVILPITTTAGILAIKKKD